ncbi:MAG: hypothetical protein V1715_04420 [bacterium]
MATLKQLQKKAKSFGLTLWKIGGNYRMSGLVHGKHTQGEFTNLKQVAAELADGWKFDKVPVIKTMKYAGKEYKIEIRSIKEPPYGTLYINDYYMKAVFPSIRRTALIQFIQDYRRIMKP